MHAFARAGPSAQGSFLPYPPLLLHGLSPLLLQHLVTIPCLSHMVMDSLRAGTLFLSLLSPQCLSTESDLA